MHPSPDAHDCTDDGGCDQANDVERGHPLSTLSDIGFFVGSGVLVGVAIGVSVLVTMMVTIGSRSVGSGVGDQCGRGDPAGRGVGSTMERANVGVGVTGIGSSLT